MAISRLFTALAVGAISFTAFVTAVDSTLRYRPGSTIGITQEMHHDELSVFTLGSDGVLRAFANNKTVLDYRQLDPDQVNWLATNLLTRYQEKGVEVPTLTALAQSGVDGRNTTDLSALWNPEEVPNLPDLSANGVTPKKVATRTLGALLPRQTICPGNPGCQSLPDCTNFNPQCNACFFQNGPPFGDCFID